jgi:arylsulfatase A-like enzyme
MKLTTLSHFVFLSILVVLNARATFASDSTGAKNTRPNVLFIAVDDLNDWVGHLGGHPQVRTPHIDRLASRGVSFTNAHCQAPICQPSRTSLLTSTYPWQNGIYMIEQVMRESPQLKEAWTIPQHFRREGYRTMGVGKIYHTAEGDPDAWDEWGGRKSWQAMAKKLGAQTASGIPDADIFDFGPVPGVRDADMSDSDHTSWAVERLGIAYNLPFFLAVGLITPHLPLHTPTHWFDQYPERSTKLPAVLSGDLDDLPPMGRKFTRYFDSTPMSHLNILRYGAWHRAVSSYLACVSFTDHCVGQLLDALDKGPYRDNTIVVLWSDHGFHLGEKMHWEKRSLWERSTHVPLMFAGSGVSPSKSGCQRTVGLIDVYPTLIELCNLNANPDIQGRSLVPLLNKPDLVWEHPAITTQHPGNHSVRTERWRLIRYANGDTELYDMQADPNEWTNLAQDSMYASVITELEKHLPKHEVPAAPQLPRNRYTQEFDWSRP